MTPLLKTLAGDPAIEALLGDEAQLGAMLRFEAALAEASAECGWISKEAAEAIAEAVGQFEPDWPGLHEGIARDGVVVPALVSQLRQTLPAQHRAALHKGATSQDVIDTALVLQLVPVLDVLQTRIAALLDALVHFRQMAAGRTLMAHTRMQAALPTTWDAKLDSWLAPLRRHLAGLQALRPPLLVIQLGGPVGDRASFDTHGDFIAARMASQLGLGLAEPWHSARDGLVALGDSLARLSGTLGKIGMDIALLAQTEVAALRLEGGGGSSAMAHKSNPVRAEILVALARFNAGFAGILQQAMIHEGERSGAAWTLEWLTLPPMLVAAGAALNTADALINQLRLPEAG